MPYSNDVMSFDITGFNARRSSIAAAIAALPEIMIAELSIGTTQAAKELAVATLQEFTPVLTGALQGSTVGMIHVDGTSVSLILTQPAKNAQGTEYAPFVIMGHHTRSGSFVAPNPYPQEAFDQMRPQINKVLRESARRIAMRTVHMMGAVGAV